MARLVRSGMKSPTHNDERSGSSIDYYAESRPASETPLDFFEISPLDRRNLVCSIGRVTGTGISASFTMASLQAFLRGFAPYHRDSAAELIRDLNRTIYKISPENFYAYLFYAWLDPMGGRLKYASAGHSAALLIHQEGGRLTRLEHTGTVLGLSRRVTYRERSIELEAGDLLIATSDGATEDLPEEEILKIIRRDSQLKLVTLVREILDSTHAGKDVAVLGVRFKASSHKGTPCDRAAELALAAA